MEGGISDYSVFNSFRTSYTLYRFATSSLGEFGNLFLNALQEVYIPFPQAPPSELGQVKFEVRTAGNPLSIIAAVRHEVQAVEKDLPLVDIGTQAETVDRSLRTERSLAKLTGFSGLLALLLASIGLYGTMSY